MKTPILNSLTVKNFRVYQNETVLFREGVNVICGRNGAGKSLLLDALRLIFGLSARSVRMDYLRDYLADSNKDASITISLNNPRDEEGNRPIWSGNEAFNKDFLNFNTIQVQRKISSATGTSAFYIKGNSGWAKLDQREREAYFQALKLLGIDPKDELIFVSGEDISVMLQKNANNRYQGFCKHLNVDRIREECQQIELRLDEHFNERKDRTSALELAAENVEQIKGRYEEYTELTKLKYKTSELEKHFAWLEVRESEIRVKNRIRFLKKAEDEVTTNEKRLKVEEMNQKQVQQNLAEIQGKYDEHKDKLERAQTELGTHKGKEIAQLNQIGNKKREIREKEDEIQQNRRQCDDIQAQIQALQKVNPDEKIEGINQELKKKGDEKAKLEQKRDILHTEKLQVDYGDEKTLKAKENQLESLRRETHNRLSKEITEELKNRENAFQSAKREVEDQQSQIFTEERIRQEKRLDQLIEKRTNVIVKEVERERENQKNQITEYQRLITEKQAAINSIQSNSSQNYSTYPPTVEQFYRIVNQSEFRDNIIGPLASSTEFDESLPESWKPIVSAILGRDRFAFITADRKAFDYLVKIQERDVKYYETIPISFQRNPKIPQKLPIPEVASAIDFVMNVLDGDILLLDYLSETHSRKLLVTTSKPNPKDARRLEGYTCYGQDGKSYQVRKKSIRRGGRRRLALQYDKVQIGTLLSTQKRELSDIVRQIQRELEELEIKLQLHENEAKHDLFAVKKAEDGDLQRLRRERNLLRTEGLLECNKAELTEKREPNRVKENEDPRIKELKARLMNLYSLVQETPEIKVLLNEIEELKEKISQSKTRYKNLIEDSKDVNTKFNAVKNEITELENEKMKINSQPQIKKLERKKTELKGRIEILESDVKIIQGTIQKSELQVEKTRKKWLEKEGELKVIKAQFQTIEGKVKDKDAQKQILKLKINDLTKTLQEKQLQKEKTSTEIMAERKALEKIVQQIQRDSGPRPADLEKMSKVTIERERNQKLGQIIQLEKKMVSEADKTRYESQRNFLQKLQAEVTKIDVEIEKTKQELGKWEEELVNVFNSKVEGVKSVFAQIMANVGAQGEIEIDFNAEEAYIWIQFNRDEKRELRNHSSGQRQIGLVAFVIALQTQSQSPITAIDEFDKGLDVVNKGNLIRIIPQMVTTVRNISDQEKKHIFDNQLIVILPELEYDSIQEGINFISVIRSGKNSSISLEET